jgi:hypothetical protein
MWGGIAIYLLIGLTWGSLFDLVEIVTPGSFVASTTSGPIEFPLFVYFSFLAITTLGGVITPVTLQAQSLVMIEPIIGTLYIAILIARLVNVIPKRQAKSEDDTPEET